VIPEYKLNYGRFRGCGVWDMNNDAKGYEYFYSCCTTKNNSAIQANYSHLFSSTAFEILDVPELLPDVYSLH